ncbi:hypothetical protein BDZ90DRAFT_262452 [Jaminaea rosea]|uniref:Uncharacterized protein n=1 Tax=Jaminaea rosea TaxID=1569628 RepID=A0A316UNB0_9BASI|nr:hypothetical protein BDZ90DRAFT_262452 [Jaminaea rosea]PWN25403.1 hypothetical protein BDZ90DRAFT_262452 [Jaminaea rosea]
MDVAERCVRVYQLEEALNLYLIEMARVDRMKGYEMEESHQKSTAVDSPVTCSDSECRHYPRLVVTESEQREVASSEEKRGPESATKDSDGENDDEEVKPLILTLAQLDRPLRRRGESGDHFDHPVFYARTGLMRLAIDEFGAVYVDHGSERFAEMYGGEEIGEPCADENCPMLHDTEPDDWDYGIPSNEVTFMHGVQKPPPLSGLKAASNEPDPAIFPGLLAICRNVLMATSQLVNLSLTGFLARPLYSNAPPLTTLRFLCIGPSSASYRDMPDLASNSVPNLEKLRLCGMRMEYYMERRIAGHLGAFLRLREFHCDSGITYADHDLIYSHVLKMVDVLQGRLTHLGAGSDEEEATASAERLSDAEPTSTAQDPTTVTQRYIELRLGRRMLDRLLTSAHTPEIRAAWRTGSEVSDAPHRLRLRKSRAARRGWESHEKSQAHQRDSDTWWDDRALECEVEAHKS